MTAITKRTTSKSPIWENASLKASNCSGLTTASTAIRRMKTIKKLNNERTFSDKSTLLLCLSSSLWTLFLKLLMQHEIEIVN